MNQSWGHLQIAGIFRKLGVENIANPANIVKRDDTGWGIDVSANVKVGERDKVLLSFVTGAGIASYMNDGGVDMAPTTPVAASAESVATGKQLYTRYCAVCHGINAEGGSGSDISPPAPDLTDSEWKRGSTDGEIFVNIRDGVGATGVMRGLNGKPGISDREMWDIVNYVRSLARTVS